MRSCALCAVCAVALAACDTAVHHPAHPDGGSSDAAGGDETRTGLEVDPGGGDGAGGAAEEPDAEPPSCEAADWTWPVPTAPSVSQAYGNPIDYQSCGFHTGIDITAKQGEDIVAVATGVVAHVGPMWYAGEGKGRGPYAIIVDHGGGVMSTYGHNSAALVAMGDCVAAGQPIAEIGSLGFSSGPHLHFEVLTGTAFTGDWAHPFDQACSHYVDPLPLIAPQN